MTCINFRKGIPYNLHQIVQFRDYPLNAYVQKAPDAALQSGAIVDVSIRDFRSGLVVLYTVAAKMGNFFNQPALLIG